MHPARVAPLALVALGVTAVVLGAGGTRSTEPTLTSTAAAWRGLAGGARPQVDVGQRVIVVLRAPSLAQRVARAGGRATDSQERQWTAAAVAAQKQVLGTLAAHGVQVRVDYNYARVINGFSAALDSEAVALLEREPEVAGVYPVRVAYPATISSELLARNELARGSAHRPEIALPGFDGRGVTIALLDTGVDRAQPFLRGRIEDGFDILTGAFTANAVTKPDDATRIERHGTEMAGLLVGAGGPEGLAGVATGATVLPIRVAGWQRDLAGGMAVYSRTDQLIAGLERAVDPNQDGDAHDAARIALVALGAPYASFADAPDARAVEGALALDTLVVGAAGNDGPAGPAFGSLSSPGGSPAALSVGAADLRSQTEQLRVVVRVGLDVLVDRMLPLAGAVLPGHVRELALATPAEPSPRSSPGGFVAPPSLDAFFNRDGLSRVAGRAALVRAGDDPVTAVQNAARAGAAAVVLYGTPIPAGGLGLDESVPVPVVAVPDDVARPALAALARGRNPALSLGRPTAARNGTAGGVAPFSSRGLSFDWRVRPDLLGPGVALMTSEPSAAEDGTPAYGTANGSSAAAATVAGAAALLAQARPDLDAGALRSVLAGYARPFDDVAVTTQGTGLVDVGAAAAAELATDPTSLAFGPAARKNWRSVQKLTIRSLSTRRLSLRVAVPQTGGAGLALTASPDRFRLRPGGRITIRIKATFQGTPAVSAPAEGTIEIGSRSTMPIRVPWVIPFGRDRAPLLSTLRLSKRRFQPSDTNPAVLSFRAGSLAGGAAAEIHPVGRLDMVLTSAYGTHLGLLVRMRNLLPGSYAFGLTGRDPNGNTLPPGDYTLSLTALPPDGSRATRRKVTFTIE